MENALWNGNMLLASDIANNYALEKEIRKASGRKELRCPDSDCQHPIVKYCHGEIKEAFFSHINNEHCDYAVFDSENNQVMRSIRQRIFDNFKSRGYQVQSEIKLLDHHYTHLLFNFLDGTRIAVEIGTQKLSANRIDSITAQYQTLGIPVKWIILGDANTTVRENQTFFIKRYALNESANHDLMVVDWNCKDAAQYKMDSDTYLFHGKTISSENYPNIYTEYGSLDNLVFESGEIAFAGFHDRFDKWLEKKKRAFEIKVIQIEEQYQQNLIKPTEEKNYQRNTRSIWKGNHMENIQNQLYYLSVLNMIE